MYVRVNSYRTLKYAYVHNDIEARSVPQHGLVGPTRKRKTIARQSRKASDQTHVRPNATSRMQRVVMTSDFALALSVHARWYFAKQRRTRAFWSSPLKLPLWGFTTDSGRRVIDRAVPMGSLAVTLHSISDWGWCSGPQESSALQAFVIYELPVSHGQTGYETISKENASLASRVLRFGSS